MTDVQKPLARRSRALERALWFAHCHSPKVVVELGRINMTILWRVAAVGDEVLRSDGLWIIRTVTGWRSRTQANQESRHFEPDGWSIIPPSVSEQFQAQKSVSWWHRKGSPPP